MVLFLGTHRFATRHVEVGEDLDRVVVGIPRYLSYFTYGSLWETYFRALGFEVEISEPSNQEILDAGVRETVNDACIPIKTFHGHVVSLRDKVDMLFVPRLAGSKMNYTVCPKFLGLPDMVRSSIPGLPRILSPRLEMGPHGLTGLRGLYRLGVELTGRRYASFRALREARRTVARGLVRVREEGLAALGFSQPEDPDLTVGLLGYPYVLYDGLSSGGIIRQLADLGIRVVTPELVGEADMRRQSREYPENLFWFYSNRSLWSGMHYMKRRAVDGLVHVTAFGCGPDAMVNKLLELEAESHGVPFMAITVDEHTGDVGLRTRIEAFVDMLRWQARRTMHGQT